MFSIQRDKKEEKGTGSCFGEKKEYIQIIEMYEITVNCTPISMVVLGLLLILRYSFPNAEAISSTLYFIFVTCFIS